jgi:hypothetical protein
MAEDNLVSTYSHIFVDKPLEVVIYKHGAMQLSQSLGGVRELHFCNLANPSFALQAMGNGACIFCNQPEEVASIGGVFFWKTIHDKTRFHSNNPYLMESLYFPTQLAKDGRGVFFEERIISRIFELGVLSNDAQIDLIEDCGGWSTLNELTAALTVHYTNGSKKNKVTLLGTALVPFPPVTPEILCEFIEKRIAFLKEIGIRPSVLRVENGVVYHRKVVPFTSALQVIAKGDQRCNLLYQCAEIAAILDANFWHKALPKLDLWEEGQFSDYLEISSPDDVILRKSFLDALGVDGSDIYWTEFKRSSRIFLGSGVPPGKWCWNLLSEKLEQEERIDVYEKYLTFKQEVNKLTH